MGKRRASKTVVERAEDIPTFASEQEEARYWSEHELGDEMLGSMEPLADDVLPTPRTAARPVSVRFEAQSLERLRALAHRRGMRYQTLLKQFVLERVYEEEQRDGLVHPHRGGGGSGTRAGKTKDAPSSPG